MIRPFAEIERDAILQAVAAAPNALDAARMLGIGKTTLYRKLKEYGGASAQTLLLTQAAALRAVPASHKSGELRPAVRYLQIPSTPLEKEQASLCCPKCRTMLVIPNELR